MDGTVTILDTEGGKQLAEKKVHTKYVVRALWAPSGDLMVSVSWDGSVTVLGKNRFPLVGDPNSLQGHVTKAMLSARHVAPKDALCKSNCA